MNKAKIKELFDYVHVATLSIMTVSVTIRSMTTPSIIILSVTTLSMMKLGIMTLSITTLNITTLSITTLSITQHNHTEALLRVRFVLCCWVTLCPLSWCSVSGAILFTDKEINVHNSWQQSHFLIIFKSTLLLLMNYKKKCIHFAQCHFRGRSIFNIGNMQEYLLNVIKLFWPRWKALKVNKNWTAVFALF